jgi:hypothetical protein
MHVLGGAVAPAVQVRVKESAYPFTAVAAPFNAAVCPENEVSGEFEIES